MKFGKVWDDCGLMVVWIGEFVIGMWFDDGLEVNKEMKMRRIRD